MFLPPVFNCSHKFLTKVFILLATKIVMLIHSFFNQCLNCLSMPLAFKVRYTSREFLPFRRFVREQFANLVQKLLNFSSDNTIINTATFLSKFFYDHSLDCEHLHLLLIPSFRFTGRESGQSSIRVAAGGLTEGEDK